jgi:predicted enzyme related to lactoylglutathione lyase
MASFFERMAMPHDALNWFEIPVRDIERAQRFYETLLDISLRREQMAGQTLAVFPYEEGRVGGALVCGPLSTAPSLDGHVLYLDAGRSIDATLARAGELGARVLLPKLQLPDDIGAIAHVADSEGNRVGLHQRP